VLKRFVDPTSLIPLRFYPVNSFIMVEDALKGTQMVVMNSVNEGGSAYSNGRIELIANRRTNSDDNLGAAEHLKELVNFKTKYFLAFTDDDRTEAFT